MHLLSSTDFTSVDVLIARAKAMVAPATKYFDETMQGKRGGQLARMKAVRFFNPRHVLARGDANEADIDGLSIFRFSRHVLIAPKMKDGGELRIPPRPPTRTRLER